MAAILIDEFDGSGLPNSAKWSYDVGGGGWGNGELQYYTSGRTENARVGGGVLTVEARKESWQGSGYTSARLVTKNKGDWLYGRMVVRAKLPRGRGSWPAIWLLPTDWSYGNWPNSGELDMMEHVGYDPGRIHCNIHTQSYNHMIGTNKGNNIVLADPFDTWHDYILEWNAERVTYFIDQTQVFSFANEHTGSTTWPFDKRFHLILNIAVGGAWGGAQGVDDAIFPARMQVDYVRVYREAAAPSSIAASSAAGSSIAASSSEGLSSEVTAIPGGHTMAAVAQPLQLTADRSGIFCEIPSGAPAHLLLLDITGQLLQEWRPEAGGSHLLDWRYRLPSGRYHLLLEQGNARRARTVVLP